ncbi:Shikimate O-hydroxycinnamoyltransferase [Citrus sinensis]|uniref:Shikimate O-hydroxycinnamoyltransferase n=1 Tax=Citrus sinensis TaxID=2711 RepID=A0ACB8ICL7_CITSI|nr:Shikimate O-hydroxycinnamoyltransferase [Citrus sinensis]
MEINVKESTIIRPAHETPQELPTVHAPGVYFYRRPSDSSNFFEAGLLKEALNNVLVRFYPMAGRLGRDENGVIHIQCNGEGALFVVAETSCVIDDFGEFESGLKLLNFVPNVDYSNDISSYPLLLAQVTHFKCGGICLGILTHHTLTDATSTFYFIKAWAEMTRGLRVPTSPKFHHIEYDPPPSINASTQNTLFQSNLEPVSSVILNLSVDQTNTLKAKSKANHGSTINFTKFEVIVAHLWRCLCKVRGLPDDQASKLLIPINGRSRLNPELPSGYIGNVLFTGTSIALSGDILSEPLNFTAERIHKALMRMDDEYLKSALAYLKQQPDLSVLKRGAHTFKCPNVNVSNLFHMPIYDANFGWGRPLFFRPIVLYDGLTHILPSPSNDGSLYLVTNLETRYIPLFKKLFYEIFAL